MEASYNVKYIQHSMFVPDKTEREQVLSDLQKDATFFDILENDHNQILWKQKV